MSPLIGHPTAGEDFETDLGLENIDFGVYVSQRCLNPRELRSVLRNIVGIAPVPAIMVPSVGTLFT
jgi:hypothetical protein